MEIYQRVHLAIEKWKNNIKSKLFNVASRAKIARYLNNDTQIKNETDQELLNLLKSIAAQRVRRIVKKKFRVIEKMIPTIF